MDFENIAKLAKAASLEIASLSSETKNTALLAVADALETNAEKIYAANRTDLKDAEKLVESGEITKSTFNRLKLVEN